MHRSRLLGSLGLIVLGVALVCVVRSRSNPDVIIHGKRLSVWVKESYSDGPSEASERAIRVAGDDVLPYLRRELAAPLDSWTAGIHPHAEKLWEFTKGRIDLTVFFKNPQARRYQALWLCLVLEEKAAPVAPLVARAMDQTTTPFLYSTVLSRMGGPGLNALTNSLLTAKMPATRLAAATGLGKMGKVGAPALPALMQAATDPNWGLWVNVLGALVQIEAPPETVVPLAASLLTNREPVARLAAVSALGQDAYVIGAKQVRSALIPLLDDPDAKVRAGADHALRPVVAKPDTEP